MLSVQTQTMADLNTNDIAVLITRPLQQANNFAQLLEASGGKAILFPTISITPSDKVCTIKKTLVHFDQYHIIIFISTNAVVYGFRFIEQFSKGWPDQLKIAAIGQSTANKLIDYAHPPDWQPLENYNSEALLELKAMQNIQGQNILIVRGHGGRAYLAEQLRLRGANVDYLEVYQRKCAQPSQTAVNQVLKDNPQIITTSSFASLEYLVSILPKNRYTELYQLPLIVVNTAMVEYAQQQGFAGPILLAKNATDQSIIDCINKHIVNHKPASQPIPK